MDCGDVSGCVPGPGAVCPTVSALNLVSGWVLDTGARLDFGQTGYVELLIDGVVIANTRSDCIQGSHGAFENCYGVNRPDVERNYPGFVNSDNAGFVFDFWAIDDGDGHIFIEIPTGSNDCRNITVISPGKHDLTVLAGDVSETGPTQIGLTESVIFVACQTTALDRPGFGNVDFPYNDQFVDGTVEVEGGRSTRTASVATSTTPRTSISTSTDPAPPARVPFPAPSRAERTGACCGPTFPPGMPV